MPQPLIFPLRAVAGGAVAAMQAGVMVPLQTQFLQPPLMRQKPRRLGNLIAPDVPVNLPWNAIGQPNLTDVPFAFPRPIHELKPVPPTYFTITGRTLDSTGAVLPSCQVNVYMKASPAMPGTDMVMWSTTSDANGVYEFRYSGQPPNAYYVVAYKPGSPDVAGTTLQTLVGQ